MKKGHQRLFIFEIILFIFLFLNSFVWNILDDNITIISLFIIIFVFKLMFGLEKDRHRYVKDVIFDLFIVLLIAFMLYYLFGIIIGFYRVGNYYNWNGMKTFIIPTILLIIFREYLRYQMINKAEGNNTLIILTTVLFFCLDISTAIYYENFTTTYDTFMFVTLVLLPSASRNITSSYIAIKLGYKPNIVWLLILELYSFLLPIIPNPNEYILAIIRFIFPLVIMYKVYTFFEKINDYEIDRKYKKKNVVLYIIATLTVIIIVYFTSGYFRYYALAIASGSMSPNINKGDIVVIEKIDKKYDLLKEGDVIAYKYKEVVVVHRIVNIIKDDGKYYFYTQGDANNDIDNLAIYEDMIIGVVNFRIPFIGLPTVWLNEL